MVARPMLPTVNCTRDNVFLSASRNRHRDYVKWRGALFHRFLLALDDESEKIRTLADFLFISFLKTKAPLLAYNNFVEVIFLLNGCKAHAAHIELHQGQRLSQCVKKRRDYVKWRGALFHRFLLALVDESEKIRTLADFLFSSFLKTKAPLLA
ncbi:uncharacterized protein LOC116249967 isoform X2 [Nymphaea colorata]|nr:uncharacterized protein LOC116249967 isoform X2 [Nymphaea colorata]